MTIKLKTQSEDGANSLGTFNQIRMRIHFTNLNASEYKRTYEISRSRKVNVNFVIECVKIGFRNGISYSQARNSCCVLVNPVLRENGLCNSV